MKRSAFTTLRRAALVGSTLALGLVMAGADAPKTFETNARYLDDRLPEAQQELLKETVGYAFPGFEAYADDLTWIANEPDASALEGKIIILQSFTTADAERRSVLRRAENLARRTEDQAIFIAIHTPENAEEAAKFAERSRIPVALDTTGRFCDDMGFWKSPAAVVIDCSGTIRMTGANVLQAARFVPEIYDETSEGEAPELPDRDEREKAKDKPADNTPSDAGVRFPEAPPVSGANDLREKKGPPLQVQKYITDEPETEGKVVMVEFWATWCGPCIAGIPHINSLQKAFPDDLVVIGVSDEDEGKVNEFRSDRRRPKFEYTVAIDPQRRMMGVVGNRGIPHCIVMSSDGIVRWQGHPGSLTRATMEAIVDANKQLGASSGGDGSMRWVKDDEKDSD
jgi:thiol-disulfide isomerase/thioredoxin